MDETIVSPTWIAEATTPASTLNSAYGYLFWLNKGGHWIDSSPNEDEHREGEERMYPDLPENIFMARGFQSQLVVVNPDMDLVITRIGGSEDALETVTDGASITNRNFVNDLVSMVIGAHID